MTEPYLVYHWGDLADQETLARRLFAGLRELDASRGNRHCLPTAAKT